MNFPVINTSLTADGGPQIFAIALPAGHRSTGLLGRGVWIYEVDDGAIARQRTISLGEARSLHAVLANPALPEFLCLGRDEADAMRKALTGAIQTFELADTLSPGTDRGQSERHSQ